jgi:hypothetical protein
MTISTYFPARGQQEHDRRELRIARISVELPPVLERASRLITVAPGIGPSEMR